MADKPEKSGDKLNRDSSSDAGIDSAPNRSHDSLASRLRLALTEAGGIGRVAQRLAIPTRTISTWLKGQDIKSQNLLRLAEACRVRPEWLLTGRGSRHADTFTRYPSDDTGEPRAFGPVMPIQPSDKNTKIGAAAAVAPPPDTGLQAPGLALPAQALAEALRRLSPILEAQRGQLADPDRFAQLLIEMTEAVTRSKAPSTPD